MPCENGGFLGEISTKPNLAIYIQKFIMIINRNIWDEKKYGIAQPLLAIALLFSLIYIGMAWDNIISRAGGDPDDQLRMVQIRDFLNGQSWFDWTQYRMNVPDGAPMHWSRVVELPIAFLILLFTPVFGQDIAEMIAGSAIPLITLAITSYIIGRITLHLWNRQAAIFAIILTWINPAISLQFRPMRIDHHGWQIMLAALALWTLFWPCKKRGGIVLGSALALWLHISLEGLPITAAFFIILGWRWIIEKAHGQRLIWTITSFTAVTFALYIMTQGLPIGAPIYCDSISPPYLAAIASSCAIMLVSINATPAHRIIRLIASAIAGMSALGLLIYIAPQCMGGAFSQMDSLVYNYWYVNVSEGLPIWQQQPLPVIMISATPIIGIIALFMIIPKIDPASRFNFNMMGFFILYAAGISFFVFRTITVSAAFAIPLIAIILAKIFEKYRRAPNPVKRIGWVILMLGIAAAGPFFSKTASHIIPSDNQDSAADKDNVPIISCQSMKGLLPLKSLQTPSQILAPFNLSPLILLNSGHYVLASSHHRNEKAMHDQIAIMINSPQDALPMLQKRKIDYIVTCPKSVEWMNYKDKHPNSLAAKIIDDKVPQWMKIVPHDGPLQIWRIDGTNRTE